jgi:hypothetical protein
MWAENALEYDLVILSNRRNTHAAPLIYQSEGVELLSIPSSATLKYTISGERPLKGEV